MSRLQKIRKLLEEKAEPARPGMKAFAEELYANEKTGTLVYHVFTPNSSLPHPVTEFITWAYFLVGNEKGFDDTRTYVASESHLNVGKITESRRSVVIPLQGYETTYFGIRLDVKETVRFKKSDFKPYSDADKK